MSIPEPVKPRVLIAEDEAELKDALNVMLDTHGYDVVGLAATGDEAMTIADALAPDLALVDYRMPGADGVMVTDHIKTRHPNTQVVMFTAYDETSLSIDATKAGVFAFLVKGCAPSLILQALASAWTFKQRLDAGIQAS